MSGHDRPHRHQAELAQETCPAHPVSTVSDSAITPKMQIWLSRYERPVEITRGRRAASTTMATTPVAPTRDLSASARRIEAEPWSQVERSSVREPFLSGATRTRGRRGAGRT